MTTPRVGVLALQGDVREHVAMFSAVGVDAVPVRRADEIASVDGLVLPGGESTTMGKLLTVFELLEPLQKAIVAGLPAYGSCAGMILLADRVLDGTDDQALIGGIDMTVRRNAFGRQVDSFEGDIDWVDGALPAVFIRAPWVESTGRDVEVLGRCDGRIVAVRHQSLLATAFHPELSDDLRVHRLFSEIVREGSS
ncbi:MAG: pyridoxal 5'-phosphate synthase glutaminase subunit PdxT [Actinomycetes bacterium]